MRPTVTSGPVVSYTAVSPLPACAGGLFSAALSLRSPWADVIRHRALRSPEVPQPCQMNDAAAAIWGSRISYYTAGLGFYAGESGWAGAPGETMNAECRVAVGGGVLILPLAGGGAWRRWVVVRVVTAPQSAADSRGDSSEQSGGESFELRYMAGDGVSPCRGQRIPAHHVPAGVGFPFLHGRIAAVDQRLRVIGARRVADVQRVAQRGELHLVHCRQDAADPQPHRLMDHRIESWLDWHRHLPNIPYRYIAGLACMLDSVRMVLYRQHCLAGKLVVPAFGDDEVHGPHDLYDDHPEQDLH